MATLDRAAPQRLQLARELSHVNPSCGNEHSAVDSLCASHGLHHRVIHPALVSSPENSHASAVAATHPSLPL